MGLFEDLRGLGVNVDEGLERLMGNPALYKRMLGSFTKMMKNPSSQPDFMSGDIADNIEKAHTIKGVTGNLSITPLYQAYSDIVRLLRENRVEEAKEVFEQVLPVQAGIINCIETYI